MTVTEDRLSELRQQLSDAVARLAELEQAAIDAMVEAKAERDISAIETRKAQARERVALLQKAINQLDRQIQLDAQQRMLDHTIAVVAPLTKALDESASKLALPPHTPDKPQRLEPDVVKPKQTFKWSGNPKQGDSSRWNER